MNVLELAIIIFLIALVVLTVVLGQRQPEPPRGRRPAHEDRELL